MSRQIPWDDIAEGGITLPPGLVKFRIEELTEETSARTAKAMIVGVFRAVEPKQVANLSLTEYFVIGTDDDPTCDDPRTYGKTVGAQRLKTMLKKSGARLAPTLEKTAKLAEGKEFVAAVAQEVEQEGKYKGRVRNRITGFFALGERKPQLDEEGAPHAKGEAKAAAVKPAVDPDEGDDADLDTDED